MRKVVSIVGARPQFIKAAAVSRLLRSRCREVLVHTGQHYDENMSAVFFRELEIAEPDINLEVGSGSHAAQTGDMLVRLEEVLLAERPDWLLIYGDTNSTLAGALAASKLNIPVAHVEAGLRSFNRAMPEEINRVLADRLSALLFCPSRTAVDNLAREGVVEGVQLVGDVMYEALMHAVDRAGTPSGALRRFGLEPRGYLLCTVHRAENTDNRDRLDGILEGLAAAGEPVVFPVHPRTRKMFDAMGYRPPPHVRLVDPVGYLDMAMLEKSARLILTDSGGIQKEAYWLGVPCVTLRDETEWVETVDAGWNRIVGSRASLIQEAVSSFSPPAVRHPLYGDGHAAERITEALGTPAV